MTVHFIVPKISIRIWHLRYLTWFKRSYLNLFFVLFQMFSDLLYPEDKAFLFIFPDLLLSLTEKSPDFLGKIYENPLVICQFIFLFFIKVDCNHRCTVVGNPGGGPWVFWQILLRGVLGVVRKSVGEVVFIAFLCGSFQKSL